MAFHNRIRNVGPFQSLTSQIPSRNDDTVALFLSRGDDVVASQAASPVEGLFVAVAERAHAVPVGSVEHALDGVETYGAAE